MLSDARERLRETPQSGSQVAEGTGQQAWLVARVRVGSRLHSGGISQGGLHALGDVRAPVGSRVGVVSATEVDAVFGGRLVRPGGLAEHGAAQLWILFKQLARRV